ncbi:MAG: nitroreductase family protein [Candidatus Omnitrophica bacterium]|nr:nitroreductase family protein [Candidatus Omnitrophota bacterium]
MESLDFIKKRRSIREFSVDAISRELLEAIVEAASFAPSARNVQPWEFVVVTDLAMLQDLGDLIENARFLAHAKACIAVYCKDTKYYLEDGCAATQNILLAATAFKIGSCWIAGDKKPYAAQVSSMLKVPDSFHLVSLVALGYPYEYDGLKLATKRSIYEILHWERF